MAATDLMTDIHQAIDVVTDKHLDFVKENAPSNTDYYGYLKTWVFYNEPTISILPQGKLPDHIYQDLIEAVKSANQKHLKK